MAKAPLTIDIRTVQAQFFDRPIMEGYSKASKQALSKWGAFVRRDARQSMRTARKVKRTKNTQQVRRRGEMIRVSSKPSPPGKPPRAIWGHIKKFLYFYYDPNKMSVVVGPVKLPRKQKSRFPVPAVHEQLAPEHAFVKQRRRRRTVTARYPKRPYMVPARNKNLDLLPSLYKDKVR